MNQIILIFLGLLIPSIFSGTVTDPVTSAANHSKFYFHPADYNDTCVITNDLTDKFDQVVNYYNRRLGFHGSVLVIQNDVPVYAKSVGYSDPIKRKKLNNNNSFELASVSKQFTAFAIMLLKQEGLLDYDDPIDNYLCNLPYKGITIRHLLNHTSGVQNYMWLLENKWKVDKQPDIQEVVDFIAANDMKMNFRPGRKFSYSNTGYVLLAAIIENVSKTSYEDFIQERIFKPLHMYTASVGSESLHAAVKGYNTYRRYYSRRRATVHDKAFGDKGIYASIWDLYKWNKEISNPKLLDKDIFEEALKPAKIGRYKVKYGFGFRLDKNQFGDIVYHNGLWNGFRTSYVKNMDSNTTIIVLNHTNSKAKNNLVKRLRRIANS